MKLNQARFYSFVYDLPTLRGKCRKLLLRISILVLIIIPFNTLGCDVSSDDMNQSEIYFPVQKEAAREVLLTLLQGDLVLDSSGCLRVHDHLILWPYGYSVNIKGDEIHVIDDKGQIVGRVGEFIKLGGGNIPAYFAEEKLGHPLPEGCEGPYFLSGGIADNS